GVLAVAKGPCLVADEFQQFNTPQKSEQDPSTSASTPPLRRFRPRQIFLVRAAVLILRAGVWGQPAHMSAISFLPGTEPSQESKGPLLSAKTSKLNIQLRPRCAKESAVFDCREFIRPCCRRILRERSCRLSRCKARLRPS